MIVLVAKRLLVRNWTRLALTFASLVIASVAFTAILGIVGSITGFFLSESKELIGGDAAIRSNVPIERSGTLLDLERRGVIFADRTESLSMTQSSTGSDADSRTALASVKVVSPTYPLYGTLVFLSGATNIPGPEEVALTGALAARLDVGIGGTVRLGTADFTVRDILLSEPDVLGGEFRLAPVLLVSASGWDRSGIDKRSSRASYTLLAKYPDGWDHATELAAEAEIAAYAEANHLRTTFAREGPRRLLRGLDTAERFFFTIIVLSLVLAIVNIRTNLLYLLASLARTIAIFRALGMHRHSITFIFLLILTCVSAGAGVAGALLGNIAAGAILDLGATYIERSLDAPHLFANLPTVIATTVLFCIVSALGFFAKLLTIAPKQLLGGYRGAEETAKERFREAPYIALALLFLFGVVWKLTESATIAAISIGSIAGIFALIALLAHGVIRSLWKQRFRFAITGRSVINIIRFRSDITASAIASLAIALGALASIALIEANVLGNLAGEFREDAPNLYVLDLGRDDLPRAREIAGASWHDFPIVRARFIERDGIVLSGQLDNEDPELSREFNITDRSEFIAGERIIAGTWHGTKGRGEVSLERDFAERAKLTLGSRVTFLTQGVRIEATVTSIREVESTSGLPFFFLVFSPDVFGDIPRTYFGYAHMSETDIANFERTLAREIPGATVLATTDIVRTVTAVFRLVAQGVVAAAIPALLLGVLLVASMLALAARERANDVLVFTALGASRKFLGRMFRRETLITILAGSVIGIGIAEVAVIVLNRWFFDFRGFYQSWNVWLGVIVILLAGLISSTSVARTLAKTPPRELFRKQ